MIFVGTTGGRCTASRAATRRPSPATRSSPSRNTCTPEPSSTIRRYSGTGASCGLLVSRSSPAGRRPVEPQVHLPRPDRVLVLAERAARRGDGAAAQRRNHHQVVRELRLRADGKELTHRVYHPAVVSGLQPGNSLGVRLPRLGRGRSTS